MINPLPWLTKQAQRPAWAPTLQKQRPDSNRMFCHLAPPRGEAGQGNYISQQALQACACPVGQERRAELSANAVACSQLGAAAPRTDLGVGPVRRSPLGLGSECPRAGERSLGPAPEVWSLPGDWGLNS